MWCFNIVLIGESISHLGACGRVHIWGFLCNFVEMTVQEEDPDETGRDSKHTQWCHCDSDVTLLLLHTQSIQVILSTPHSDDITYVTSLFCISDTGSDFIAFPCNKLWYTYKILKKKRENSFREISSYNLRTCGNAMACLPDWPVSYLSVLQKRKKRPSQHLETPWFGVLLPPSVETWIIGWPICESEAHLCIKNTP